MRRGPGRRIEDSRPARGEVLLWRWVAWVPSSSRCCRLGNLAPVEQRTDQCVSPAEALLFGGIQFLVCKRRFNVSEQYREDDCERNEGSV